MERQWRDGASNAVKHQDSLGDESFQRADSLMGPPEERDGSCSFFANQSLRCASCFN